MKLDEPHLFRYFGWNTQGDLGPWTMYTDRRRGLVYYLRAPPKEPASYLQQIQRQRFAAAADAWRKIGQAARQAWNQIAITARLRITGFNLWTYANITNDWTTVHTIQTQTGVTLPHTNT